ncbi:transposase [Streptomyces sp. NPDC088350]|uniref:transposase n=1 Tax=Streptomyces sp. NPDC088350 TaxID=3365854 RepID=UPI0038241225
MERVLCPSYCPAGGFGVVVASVQVKRPAGEVPQRGHDTRAGTGADAARRTRSTFIRTPEFQAEIVELCRRGDRSAGQIAKDLDRTETAVRPWVSQADADAGERDGPDQQ